MSPRSTRLLHSWHAPPDRSQTVALIPEGVLRPPLEPRQYTSIRYTERLDEIGATPSIGSVADSYDNALAETINGLYKTESISRRGLWRDVDQVELATLNWVHWFNNERLHSALGDIPPAEFEQAHYAQPAAVS